jgi:pyruvate formate lyase activating enzyme
MAVPLADIKGIVPVSMLDWDGKLVSTLFLGGCNLRCCYCQNGDLVQSYQTLANISWQKVKEYLRNKSDWLDGCVISGGEPCTNRGLTELLSQIKKLGYPIKLDTNGTLPRVLSQLIKDGLIDYIAMDVKTSFNKYPQIIRAPLDAESLKKSFTLIMNAVKAGSIDAEFRTTVIPSYVGQDDLLEIARYLGELGAARYYLQQFNPNCVLERHLKTVQPYSDDRLDFMANECSRFVPTVYRAA